MRSPVLVVAGVLVAAGLPLVGCASAPAAPAPVAVVGPELDGKALCLVVAQVADATARLKLHDQQASFEAAPGLEARFGALLSTQNEQDRFRAFHDETTGHAGSAVGPLGECFVYAEWKMADQAKAPCAAADALLNRPPVVDVARASLKRRAQQLAEASVLLEGALARDATCPAAHMEYARVHEAVGDKARAMEQWEKALTAWPQCLSCALEAARLVEATQGRDAAVAAWERALALAPDHPDALKRYGAALAGKDDARALAAYEKAISLGVVDVQTFLGAAQLAKALDVVKALNFAERATREQKNDVDAWRLVMSLAGIKGDDAKAEGAAREVVRLAEEDVAAHLVLARAAQKSGDMVAALAGYDLAARAIAAGRTEPLTPTQLEAVRAEHKALLKELSVPEAGIKGTKEVVVSSVRKTVQGLFTARLKQKKGLKGALDVNVITVESGAVSSVEIEKDTLADPWVAASVVGNLRRATIVGGAKRYGFTLEFQ